MILHHDIDSLLVSDRLVVAMVEHTTKCNLKCSYCKVSQKGWKGKELPPDVSMRVMEQIAAMHPEIVIMHGHGETTIATGWVEHSERYHNMGIKLSICSNLAKRFTDEEIDALARFRHIAVSIDTLDASLFSELRKGGEIETVLRNMRIIQERALERHNDLSFTWSVVCCDRTMPGILDLVKTGIALGVSGFTFCNLSKYADLRSDINLLHVSELPNDECEDVIDIFEQVKSICQTHGVVCQISAGIIDSLIQKVYCG